MREITRKLVGITTGLALALGLAACGPAVQPDPTNAAELIERYEACENKDNYHGEGTVGASFSLLGMKMPVEGTLKLDKAGDDAHYVIESSGEVFGNPIQNTLDSHATREGDAFTVYTRNTDANGEGQWVKSTVEDDKVLSNALIATDKLKEAEFAATEDGYTLTMNSDDASELFNSVTVDDNELFSSIKDDISATPAEDSKIVYTFGKDFLPTNATFKLGYDFSYNGDATEVFDLSGVSMSIGIDISIDFTGYGSVDESTVAVPDDVKATATEAKDVEGADIAPFLTDVTGGTDATETADAA